MGGDFIGCSEDVTVETVKGIAVGTTGAGMDDFKVELAKCSETSNLSESAMFCGRASSVFKPDASHFSGPI